MAKRSLQPVISFRFVTKKKEELRNKLYLQRINKNWGGGEREKRERGKEGREGEDVHIQLDRDERGEIWKRGYRKSLASCTLNF